MIVELAAALFIAIVAIYVVMLIINAFCALEVAIMYRESRYRAPLYKMSPREFKAGLSLLCALTPLLILCASYANWN